jgi:LmbE family N-acetylglucosaminyl deacetylase
MSLHTPNELLVVAHPDDLETMLGHHAVQSDYISTALIATDGEASTVNFTDDPTFVASGQRRQESINGLEHLGIAQSEQIYLGLPDGGLRDRTSELARAIAMLVSERDIRRVVTLGEHGYDGHQDHVATHHAAALAIAGTQANQRVKLQALSHSHEGAHRVLAGPSTTMRKLSAMAYHASQFPASVHHWHGIRPYAPLIHQGETYDIQQL